MNIVDVFKQLQRNRMIRARNSRALKFASQQRQELQDLQQQVQRLQSEMEQLNTEHEQIQAELQNRNQELEYEVDQLNERIAIYMEPDRRRVTELYPQELDEIISEQPFRYFRDQHRKHCVLRALGDVQGGGSFYRYETEDLDEKTFELWLRGQYRDRLLANDELLAQNRELKASVLKIFIERLKSRNDLWQTQDNNRRTICKKHLRFETLISQITAYSLHLYVDLTDQDRRIIRISSVGCYYYGEQLPIRQRRPVVDILGDGPNREEIDRRHQTYFKRYPHQKDLTIARELNHQEAVRALYARIWEYIRIIPEQRALFIGYLATCLVSHIQHPVLAIFEPENHGRKTTMRFIKQLVDHSDVMIFNKQTVLSPKGIEVARQHYWIPVNDVQKLTQKESDMLYALTIGIEDHHNDHTAVIERCMAISGPKKVKLTPVLTEKTLRFRLERIEDEQFQRREILGSAFDFRTGEFRQGLFSLLSGAIRRIENQERAARVETVEEQEAEEQGMQRSRPETIRDEFRRWARVVAEELASVMNDPQVLNEFDSAYQAIENERRQEDEDENPLPNVVLDFLERYRHGRTSRNIIWSGPASQLLMELQNHAHDSDIIMPSEVPSNPNSLSKALNDHDSRFKQDGIEFSRNRTHQGRTITFTEM